MSNVFSTLYSKILHIVTFLPSIYFSVDMCKSGSNHPEVLYKNSCSKYLKNIQENTQVSVLL